MSITQRMIDELREIADKINHKTGQSSRYGQLYRLEGLAQRIRECADDLGND